ncbi:MAG TPA: hypothetical protein VFX60_12655 [Micromonospora sp.]|nr:hypothetical protein [Micromonospora sp.]
MTLAVEAGMVEAVMRSQVLARQLPHIFGPSWRPVWRGRSGLTDPEPPATSRFTPAFDKEIALQTDAVLRLAAYDGSQSALQRARYTRCPPRLPTFSPAVRYAVFTGLQEAGRSGLRHVGMLHLIVGLLSVPGGAAGWIMRHLTHANWRPGRARLVGLAQFARDAPGRPPTDMVDLLIAARVLPVDREPRFWSRP